MMSRLEWILQPDRLILLGLVVVAVFLARGWVVSGRRILYCIIATALFISIAPLGGWLVSPLEERFPRPSALPSSVTGILVLAGGEDVAITASRGVASLREAGDRLLEAVILARSYPNLPVVYSGGRPWSTDVEKNALAARTIFSGLGLDSARITYEMNSRNTAESAVLARRLVSDTRGWLLVTSASHMPRAVGAFRAQGWEVLAFPVDYKTQRRSSWGGFSFTHSTWMISTALHEWGGLIWYRFSGRSSSFFPSP